MSRPDPPAGKRSPLCGVFWWGDSPPYCRKGWPGNVLHLHLTISIWPLISHLAYCCKGWPGQDASKLSWIWHLTLLHCEYDHLNQTILIWKLTSDTLRLWCTQLWVGSGSRWWKNSILKISFLPDCHRGRPARPGVRQQRARPDRPHGSSARRWWGLHQHGCPAASGEALQNQNPLRGRNFSLNCP